MVFVAYFFLCKKYIWQALLEEIWQPKICQGQASLLERASFQKFEYIRQARVVKKIYRSGIGREFWDAVWEMALEILGEGKSRTLSQPCASSSSLPLITNTLAWISQSDCSSLQISYSFLLLFTFFQLTLSFQHVLWVANLTATAAGCEGGDLGTGDIKIMGFSLV